MSLTDELQQNYVSFYADHIIPLLGPSPQKFSRFRNLYSPSSHIGDDHSPMEVNWVIEGDGSSSMQFAMELLSPIDGSPASLSDCTRFVNSLANLPYVYQFDNTWSEVCRRTLGYEPKGEAGGRPSHFIFGKQLVFRLPPWLLIRTNTGAKFGSNGMMGKVYYEPEPRAYLEGCSSFDLVSNCMRELGITGWDEVLRYINTLPNKPTIPMVSVDLVEPSKNRIKVYFRYFDRTLDDAIDHLTLGGTLKDIGTQKTVESIRQFSAYLFPGVPGDAALRSNPLRANSDWPGFLIYFEMGLNRPTIATKLYIPVRQYCDSDLAIVESVAKYFKDNGLAVGQRYSQTFKELL